MILTMVSAAVLQFISGMIVLAFAYVISVTIIGYLQAKVAGWAGDSTPEEEGFTSGIPWNYIDLFGFFSTVFLGFGWGRLIPFRPSMVCGPHRTWKVLAVYLTQPLTSLWIALCAFVGNILIIGPTSLCFALHYTLLDSFLRILPINLLAQSAPHVSSAGLVIAMFFMTMISINIFLAIWSSIHNICYHLLYLGSERGYHYMRHAELILVTGPLFLFIFFAPALKLMFLKITSHLAFYIAQFLGIL